MELRSGFGWNHYVPVLRWKRGEYRALKELSVEVRRRITPLIELLPVEEKRLDSRLGWLADTCRGSAPFLDLGLLPQNHRIRGERAWRFVSTFCRDARINAVPVMSPFNSTQEQRAVLLAAEHVGSSICIRSPITSADSATLSEKVRQLLDGAGIGAEDTHLIADFGPLTNEHPPEYRRYEKLRDIGQWKTIALVAGAFPENLTMFSVGQHELPRNDWMLWRDTAFAKAAGRRIPAYGDYTIQHGTYKEPPAGANPSASIRYAAKRHWVVMRGQGLRHTGSPGHQQYIGNAMLLVARREFCGADFSAGDAYIAERTAVASSTGSPETWLRAGINHHMTLVVREIERLSAVSERRRLSL